MKFPESSRAGFVCALIEGCYLRDPLTETNSSDFCILSYTLCNSSLRDLFSSTSRTYCVMVKWIRDTQGILEILHSMRKKWPISVL